MTVIRPNSISGVTSITALANEINVFKHDGVLAGLQLNGVNHHTSSGVSTFHTLNVLGNVSVGGTLTYQDVTNIDSVGIITARSTIDAQGDVSIADKIIHTGDTNTAIRFPVGDVISAETNGAERLRITSAGTLLLGTSTGALANGNGIVIADATAARLSLKDTTNGVTGTDGFDVVQTGTDAYLYHRENGNMIFGTNATERFRIDSSGRIGVGVVPTAQYAHNLIQIGHQATLGANAALSATGQTFLTHNLYFDTGGTFRVFNTSNANEGAIFRLVDGQLLFSNSAATTGTPTVTERFRIDSSGRLLIGTTTEGHPAGDNLTVADSSNAGITIRSGTTSNGALYFSDGTSGADEYRGGVVYHHDGNYMRFYTNGTERIRIDSSGKFHVKTHGMNLENATATNSRGYSITNAAGTTGWTFGNGITASSHQYVIYDNTAGSARLQINGNGAFGLNGNNYGAARQVMVSNGSGSAVSWSSNPFLLDMDSLGDVDYDGVFLRYREVNVSGNGLVYLGLCKSTTNCPAGRIGVPVGYIPGVAYNSHFRVDKVGITPWPDGSGHRYEFYAIISDYASAGKLGIFYLTNSTN